MCSGFAEQGRGELEVQEASADAFRFDLLAIDSGDFTFVEQQNDAELLRASAPFRITCHLSGPDVERGALSAIF